MPISFCGFLTLLLKSYAFAFIRKLDVNQYIFAYTFNQPNICNDLSVIHSVIISQAPFTPLKNRIMCLIGSHGLTANRPTLTIVVIQSVLSLDY